MLKRYKESILYITFILIIFVFAITKIYPAITNIITVEKSIDEATVQAADLERKLETLKKTEEEKANAVNTNLKKIYKPEVTGLDTESSFTVIFDDVIEMTKLNGIKVYSIQYTYNPTDDDFVKGDPNTYNVCQLDMQLISDYQDLESFLKELYKYPYLVNIGSIEVTPYNKNKKILLTTLQLKLYVEKNGEAPSGTAPAVTTTPAPAPAPAPAAQ